MNTQNYTLSFLSKAPQMGVELKKSNNPSKDDTFSFKSILNDRVSNLPSSHASVRNSDKSGNINSDKNVQQNQEPQFKSYKEIAKPQSNKKLDQSEKVSKASEDSQDEGQDESSDKIDEKSQADYVLQSLAAVLGIDPQEFKKMLEKMNVNPEELVDASKLDSVVEKLSVQMNLNEDQKKTLEAVIKQVADSVKQSTDEMTGTKIDEKVQKPEIGDSSSQADAKGKIEVVNSKDQNIGSDKVNSEAKNFEDVMKELKQKLNVLRDQLQQNPRKALDEIADEVKSIVAKSTGQDAVKPDETDVKSSSQIENSDKKQKAVEKADAKQDVQQNEQHGKNENASEEKQSETDKSTAPIEIKHTNTVTAAKSQDNSTIRFDNLIQNQTNKVNDTSDIPKVQKEIPIQKNEIINQVVEKAKVVLTGDKSEMVMDLKPDSLGKISLKVVTERGMVVAKFIAENQQVKETLEANMQLLKDSLQKQGMAVQGFSVSVDQNPYKGFNMNNGGSNRNNSHNSKESSSAGPMVNVANIPETIKAINPYSWSESKINLTA